MGFVYRARHNILGREYALKTLGGDQVSDTSWRRFQIEAQAIAKMAHPNVVGIHNFALHHREGQADIPFYVMDLLEGSNLMERLRDNGTPPLSIVLSIFQQAAAGLGYAHSKGMIHRDVKPGNIVLLNRPDAVGATVKIVDFGIAKLTDSQYGAQKLTTAGEVFGSPLYMSPEQSMAQALDPRTDIYSLGVTLFEALVGDPPFIANSAVEVMMMHQSEPVPVINSVSEVGYPPEVQQVVEKMMAKMPEDRYQTMEQVAADLAAIARGQEPALGAYRLSDTGRFEHRSSAGDSAAVDALADTRAGRVGSSTVGGPLLSTTVSSDGSALDFPELDEEPDEKTARAMKSIFMGLAAVTVVVSMALFFVFRQPDWIVKTSAVAPKPESTMVTDLGKIDANVGVGVFRKGGTDYSDLEATDSGGSKGKARRNSKLSKEFGGQRQPPSLSQHETFRYSKVLKIDGGMFRRFQFPTDITIGRFEADRVNRPDLAQEAHGTVDLNLKYDYTFTPYRCVEDYPQYMKRFRPGDVTSVSLVEDLCRDKVLDAVSYIPGVISLKLSGSDGFTDSSVAKSLRRFKSLSKFDAKSIGVSGAALAQANCWQKIKYLWLSEVYGLQPLIELLKKCPELEGLTLGKTNLTSRDIEVISTLSNLRGLDLSQNKITVRDLKTLSKLPHLEYLNLQMCGLDHKAILGLKSFPQLRTVVVITPGPNQKAQSDALSKELRTIKVY